MKNIFIVFLLTITSLSFGQKTKTLGMRGSKYYEIYDVLKKGKDIKHGTYKKYRNDDVLIEKGTYSYGQKVGTWSYYGWKGELCEQYNYEKSKITFYSPEADTTTTIIRINGVLQRVRLEWPPECLDENERIKFIRENVIYPLESRERGESGVVYISFFLTKEGTSEDYIISKGAFPLLDEEALRVVKLVPINWNPAKHNGEAVDVFITMPINFRIE